MLRNFILIFLMINVIHASQGGLLIDLNKKEKYSYGISANSNSETKYIKYNDKLYFSASDGFTSRYEVWVNDGSTTTKVIGVDDDYYYTPQHFTVYKDKLYFVAYGKDSNGNDVGRELYVYDGISIKLVEDFYPERASGDPSNLIVYKDKLYFTAQNAQYGKELFSYDGNNISLVEDLKAGATGSYPSKFFIYEDKLLFQAGLTSGHGQHMYDGNSVTLLKTQDNNPFLISNHIIHNGKIYFSFYDTDHGTELWVYDGTSAYLVDEIYPGNGSYYSSNPKHLTMYDNKIYFSAKSDDKNGTEVYAYDGNTSSIAANIYEGVNASSDPEDFIVYKDNLYFSAKDSSGYHLFSYDGNNTSIVKSVGAKPSNFMASYLFTDPFVFNDKLYFVMYTEDESDRSLWAYDGNTVVKQADNIPSKDITVFEDRVYFSSNDGVHGNEVWYIDENNVSMLVDINRKTDGFWTMSTSEVSSMAVFNSKLYFSASNGEINEELWSYDGVNDPQLIEDINDGEGSSDVKEFVEYKDTLYFNANDGVHGDELMKLDENNTVQLVKDLRTGMYNEDTMNSGDPRDLTVYKDKLYFKADSDDNGSELWVHDGNTTKIAFDLSPGRYSSSPEHLIVYKDKLFFYAKPLYMDPRREIYGLYTYDGNTTNLVSNIRKDGKNSYAKDFVIYGDKLYFSAYNSDSVRKLWVFDGTSTYSLASTFKEPSYLTVYNGILYFRATDDESGSELWSYDGNSFIQVNDIVQGSDSSYPYNLTVYNDKLYFSANHDGNGNDLMYYDGSEIVVETDENRTIPETIVANDTLYYVLDSQKYGTELHYLKGTPTPKSSNFSFTIDEESNKTFSASDFSFTGLNDGDSLNSIVISRLPYKGELKLNGNSVVLDQEISVSDISNLVFIPAENGVGTPYTLFGYRVNDGSVSSSVYNVNVNITNINDAPSVISDEKTVEVDVSLISEIGLKTLFTDPDPNDTFTYSFTNNNPDMATVVLKNDTLVVVPNAGKEGNITVELTVSDGEFSDTKTVTIQINPETTAPMPVIPGEKKDDSFEKDEEPSGTKPNIKDPNEYQEIVSKNSVTYVVYSDNSYSGKLSIMKKVDDTWEYLSDEYKGFGDGIATSIDAKYNKRNGILTINYEDAGLIRFIQLEKGDL